MGGGREASVREAQPPWTGRHGDGQFEQRPNLGEDASVDTVGLGKDADGSGELAGLKLSTPGVTPATGRRENPPCWVWA